MTESTNDPEFYRDRFSVDRQETFEALVAGWNTELGQKHFSGWPKFSRCAVREPSMDIPIWADLAEAIMREAGYVPCGRDGERPQFRWIKNRRMS